MINPITSHHYDQILKINQEFVHWLSPLDSQRLDWVLSIASYKRQIDNAQAVLFGYPHDADYPDHKNMTWLSQHVENYFYIDRIIIDPKAQGQGYGKRLYQDIEKFARKAGFKHIACEVNTKPNNPRSHAFHLAMGFVPIGDQDYPEYDAALRYYIKSL